MSIISNIENMTDAEKLAVLESVQKSIAESKEIQKKKIGENVNLVISALKKIESDIQARYDAIGTTIENRVASIKDGKDGKDGRDGVNGRDGKAGRDGAKGDKGDAGLNGRDGVDGRDGVSVTDAKIDFDGSLVITLSSGQEINVGEVVSSDIAEKIKVINTMSTNAAIAVKEEGSTLTNGVKSINFVGTGITATTSGDDVTVTVASGSGTVTSVAATGGTGISVTGSPITTSGTLTITNTAPDQTVALTAGTGISTSGTYPNFTITNSAPDQTVALTGAGTTSVTGTYPNFTITSNDQFQGTVTSVTGTSPVASTGGVTPAISLSAGYGDTLNPYASKTANFVLAAPNGSAGVPTFRAIVAADIPTLNQNTTGTASNVTGTVAIANGGTGATTAATALTNLGAVAKAGDTMTGALGFVAGSASTPSLFASGDTNTGIFFPAADTIAFSEGGVEVARFDSSGNFGVGTSTFNSVRTVIQGSQTGGAPQTSGTAQTYGLLRLQGTTFTSVLDFGTNGGNYNWIQATDNSNLATTYPLSLNPVGGNVGIGTSSPTGRLNVDGGAGNAKIKLSNTASGNTGSDGFDLDFTGTDIYITNRESGFMAFENNGSERMRIDSSGNLLVGTTDTVVNSGAGIVLFPTQGIAIGKTNSDTIGACMYMNRATVGDGGLIEFAESGTIEGTITISGTTVSYNGGHLSRWAQMLTKPDLLKGTVMSNLDEMNEYVDADGNPVPNEQLNKVKVSDIEGDANVAGVFVNWTHDEAHNVDEINMAMTGDMIIRIAQGTTVQRGDLLMSAGDGTAKPQGDDIVRSKTVAKVTSTHVTCTYADGSFCVPCVLMAC